MGDSVCDRRFCPACDLAVSRERDACPECGAPIRE